MPGTSALVLVVAYLAGYIFLARSSATRYGIRHFEGHLLLFHAALWALFFLFPARLVCYLISTLYPGLYQFWHTLVPIGFLGTAVGAILLALSAAELVNGSLRIGDRRAWARWNRLYIMVWTVNRYGSPLERLLLECFYDQKPLVANLKNDKVYVGYVVSTPDFAARLEYFEILPMVSGYRDHSTRRLVFTTEYYSAYQNFLTDENVESRSDDQIVINSEDFRLVIPVSEIFTVSPFESDFYRSFEHESEAEEVSLADTLHSIGKALINVQRLFGRYLKKKTAPETEGRDGEREPLRNDRGP